MQPKLQISARKSHEALKTVSGARNTSGQLILRCCSPRPASPKSRTLIKQFLASGLGKRREDGDTRYFGRCEVKECPDAAMTSAVQGLPKLARQDVLRL